MDWKALSQILLGDYLKLINLVAFPWRWFQRKWSRHQLLRYIYKLHFKLQFSLPGDNELLFITSILRWYTMTTCKLVTNNYCYLSYFLSLQQLLRCMQLFTCNRFLSLLTNASNACIPVPFTVPFTARINNQKHYSLQNILGILADIL